MSVSGFDAKMNQGVSRPRVNPTGHSSSSAEQAIREGPESQTMRKRQRAGPERRTGWAALHDDLDLDMRRTKGEYSVECRARNASIPSDTVAASSNSSGLASAFAAHQVSWRKPIAIGAGIEYARTHFDA